MKKMTLLLFAASLLPSAVLAWSSPREDFSSALYISDVSRHGQSRAVWRSTSGGMQTVLTMGMDGMVIGEVSLGGKWQLLQVNGHEWTPNYAGLTARPDAFISGTESLLSQENGKQHIAGAWVTSLSDVRVNFPGAEEPVKRWQGYLTPVVVYF